MTTYTTYTETYDQPPGSGHQYHFTMGCRLKDFPHTCQAGEKITIPGEALFRYNSGQGSIQDCLSMLTPEQREWFGQSGFCPAGFEALFAEED